MSEKSIDDMKQELEANEYRFFAWGSSEEVYAPDGWHFETSYHYGDASEWWSQFEDAKQRLLKAAYAHLQEQRELMALRAFVLNILSVKGDHPYYNEIVSKIATSIAIDLDKQYNITAESE